MTWNVRLFAHLREAHGDLVSVESEANVESVLAALQRSGIDSKSCRLATADEFVRAGDMLSPGDELSLIPPVSGG